MKNKFITKKAFGLAASLLAALSLLALAATPVFAKPLSPLSVPTIKSTLTNDQLSALFAHEHTWFGNLHPGADIRMTSLTEAEKILADSEKFDAQVANFDGSNARELRESGLAKEATTVKLDDLRIKEQVSIVRNLLDAHSGFNKDGDVINSAAALNTVRTIDAYLTDIQYFINHANSDLSRAEADRIKLSSLSLQETSK